MGSRRARRVLDERRRRAATSTARLPSSNAASGAAATRRSPSRMRLRRGRSSRALLTASSRLGARLRSTASSSALVFADERASTTTSPSSRPDEDERPARRRPRSRAPELVVERTPTTSAPMICALSSCTATYDARYAVAVSYQTSEPDCPFWSVDLEGPGRCPPMSSPRLQVRAVAADDLAARVDQRDERRDASCRKRRVLHRC